MYMYIVSQVNGTNQLNQGPDNQCTFAFLHNLGVVKRGVVTIPSKKESSCGLFQHCELSACICVMSYVS